MRRKPAVAVNLIVLAVTLLMAGFVAVWCLCPRLRPWMEAPKYRILTWQHSDPGAVRQPDNPCAASENPPLPLSVQGSP
jgi:hypothetical protein